MQSGTNHAGVVILSALLLSALPSLTSAQPYAYVSNITGNNVSVVNTATHTVSATISTPAGPAGIAVTPDGRTVYVAAETNNSVTAISTSSNSVIKTIPVGGTPVALAVNPAGTQVYVASQSSNQISVIDTGTESVIATITVGQRPVAVAFSPDGSRAFVANLWSNSISVISTSSRSVISTFAALSGPGALVVSPNYVYVANESSNAVTVHSQSTGAIVATISGFTYPDALALTPNLSRLFVANGNGGSVSVVDTASRSILATVPTGAIPTSVTISADGTQALVTNENGLSLSEISTATNTVVNTIQRVGVYPYAVAMMPATPVTSTGCTFSLSKTSQAFGSAGGTGSVAVTTQSGCTWTASSNVSWASITSISGGTVNFSVNADTTASGLSGSLTIAGSVFTITVSGTPCAYSLSSSGVSLGFGGGTGSVTVTAPAGCGWQTSTDSSWLSVSSGLSGTGNGAVAFSASANTSLTSRTGHLTVGGKTFSVTEAGEAFSAIRVNCGGPGFTDSTGQVWAADNLFNHTMTTAAIANTTIPALYQTESWTNGTLRYQFSVPNGSYTVRLHFAEIYLTQRGERVFNIVLNGVTESANFDILAVTTPNAAYEIAFPVNVTTGQLVIQLVPVVGPPKLSGLEIF